MHNHSHSRFSGIAGICATAWSVASLLAPSSAAAVEAVPNDLQVVLQTFNSGSNPGPFSAGSNALINARFRIDASVTPEGGGLKTWAGALDDLVLTVEDSVLGNFTINGQNGKWQQLEGDFVFGGWDLATGLSPFSIVNPAITDTPFVLESISFDFRGPELFASTVDLPTDLSYIKGGTSTDFGFLDLTLRFSNADTSAGAIPKLSIIRGSAFQMVTVSAVPEPQTLAMLLAGLLVVGGTAARRRG